MLKHTNDKTSKSNTQYGCKPGKISAQEAGWERKVFSWCPKDNKNGACVLSKEREFQQAGANTVKARFLHLCGRDSVNNKMEEVFFKKINKNTLNFIFF